MYSLDINFLKDRDTRIFDTKPQRSPFLGPVDRTPLLYGLLGALVPLALVVGYGAFNRNQVRQLEARSAELEAELVRVRGQLQEIGTLRGQIDGVKAENQAFVSVFDQIVPWSALLQDIRDRTPTRIQITRLTQTAGVTPAATPEAPPPQVGGVSIEGVACNFNDINDFTLVLQRSPLLNPGSVAIERAEQQAEMLDPLVQGRCPGTPADAPSYLVDYTLRANLPDTPASELIEELEQQGAVGLVTRLRALRNTGVLER